ncbi:hypothetical protein, partial [Maribellus sediminis]|uniref:hypothetical protein n=1 Tax=Maribellus sediminis TaxID=2696285 RepID=UPI0014312BD6
MKEFYWTSKRCCTSLLFLLSKSKWRGWLFLPLFMFSLLVIDQSANAQAISEGPGVIGSFGVDGDVSANWQHRGPETANVDDWFDNDAEGTGEGIIWFNSSSIYDLGAIMAMVENRAAFELRQKYAKGSNHADANGVVYAWLDGVYGRDHHTAGGTKDSTVFTGTKDKNSDNPNTWNVGTGDTPQKNDLVDVMGYLRRETVPDSDGHAHLWAYGGASTRSADGTSHVDFEFFRKEITVVNGMYSSTGDEEGHTGWWFDETGEPTQQGDIIVSIDLNSGGEHPLYSIRVWMRVADLAGFNSLGNRPFNVTGVYNQGVDVSEYCYAEIQPKDDFNGDFGFLYATVDSTEVPAAPWGTLEGSQADTSGNFIPYQFTEIGVNMTAFGLDGATNEYTPCSNILGTLFVKTRSSGEFTAELKDFAGPYIFGYSTEVLLAAGDIRTCVSPEATNVVNLLNATIEYDDTKAFDPKYYESMANALSGTDPLPLDTLDHYHFTGDSVIIYVSAESREASGCFGADSFIVRLYPDPVCSNITKSNSTWDILPDGWAKVDTTGALTPIVSITWSFDDPDGQIGGGQGTDSIWGLSGSEDGVDYYVTLVDANGCTATCTTTISTRQYLPPECFVEVTDATCDGNSDGTAKWQNVTANWANYEYYWTKLVDGDYIPVDPSKYLPGDTMVIALDSGEYRLEIYDPEVDRSVYCGGVVGDRDSVGLTCPVDPNIGPCLTDAQIMSAFDAWLVSAIFNGDSTIYNDWNGEYPDKCGEVVTVNFWVNDTCADPGACQTTFTVIGDDVDPEITPPQGYELAECNQDWPTS